MEKNSSRAVAKEHCPDCGSRDNLIRYSDGHAYCFSVGCDRYEPATGEASTTNRRHAPVSGPFITGEYRALPKRGITEETCRKFGYQVGRWHGKTVQITPFYNSDGELVAQQLRTADKDFPIIGSLDDALLDGQHLWERGGRKVVITEGGIDKMSVSQVQGNKWPVISIPNGTKGAKKFIARQLEWLCSFEEVVLMFDMDEPGRIATAECAALFPPGKCKVATLSMKDPNELLLADKGDEIISAIWQAKTYRPDGIVTISDIKDKLLTPKAMGLPWFLPTLTKHTYGRHWCHIYALGAGTGVGKTDLLTQQMMFDMTELNEKIGVFSMEQPPEETVDRIAGKFAGKCFHIPDDGWTEEERLVVIEKLEREGKLFLYDSFGATDWEAIQGHIRYLNHSEGVRIFYIDHLTALAAAEDDERKGLERIMAQMSGLAKELRIIIHLVSHLASPEGKPHEEGGRVMIKHFKGSRAIGFWCHAMYAMERNQQPEEDDEKRTIFRILKDRFAGRATGKTIILDYDPQAGRLFEAKETFGFEDQSTQPGEQQGDF
jgi:twinkle protein